LLNRSPRKGEALALFGLRQRRSYDCLAKGGLHHAQARGCDKYGGGIYETRKMERKKMTVFEKVKAAVSTRDAAQMYGMNVRSNGMTNCPFHEDHNPSMKLDQNFYCFGCHAHGDVIDFVSRLFGISRYGAAVKLAADFGISESPPTCPNIKKTNAEPFRPSVTFCIFLLRDYLHLLWLWCIRYEPTAAEEIPNDHFIEACENIPVVQNLLDELRDKDAVFQKSAHDVLLENENWKKLQDHLKKEKAIHEKKEDAANAKREREHCA